MSDSIKRTVDDNDIRSLLLMILQTQRKLEIETKAIENILLAKEHCFLDELDHHRQLVRENSKTVKELDAEIEKLSILILYREGELQDKEK